MIPSIPSRDTKSDAERKVFDKLKSAFETHSGIRPIAFHSLGLTRHKSKRFAEADFVIVGAHGVFVLEVKGGGISVNAGQWCTQGRSGKANINDPFKQAEGALHAIRTRIEEKIPELRSQFCVGHGVVFSDCRFQYGSAEWDRAMIADLNDCRDLEGWLEKFYRYWGNERNQSNKTLNSKSVKRISDVLRPEFEVARSLQVDIDDVDLQIMSLTEDQMVAVDIIEANPRVLCEGGAGTGKTFLAMELARRHAEAGKNVLLVCRSLWLKRYLESKFILPNFDVALIEGLATTARRSGVDQYDVLLVDEGQDLFDMRHLDAMEKYVKGGLSEGCWTIFHDVNQQSGFFDPVDPEAYEYLQSIKSAIVPLKSNCRNSKVILDRVKSDLKVDMGVRGAGGGPDVRSVCAKSREESADLLDQEIGYILDGGVSPSQVTILTPAQDNESCWMLLPKNRLRKVVRLDEYQMRSFPPPQISICRISDFKGLENEAVILVDVPQPSGEIAAHERTSLYVGMSRSRALLSIIYCE